MHLTSLSAYWHHNPLQLPVHSPAPESQYASAWQSVAAAQDDAAKQQCPPDGGGAGGAGGGGVGGAGGGDGGAGPGDADIAAHFPVKGTPFVRIFEIENLQLEPKFVVRPVQPIHPPSPSWPFHKSEIM